MEPIAEGVLKLLGGLPPIITPFIQDHFAQKITNEYVKRLADWEILMETVDSDDRATRLAIYLKQLCLDAGTTPGGISGLAINVPVSYLNALVQAAANKIKDEQTLNRMEYKLSQ